MAGLARRHRVALVGRWTLNQAERPPDVLELPGLGQLAGAFANVILLHRQTSAGEAEPNLGAAAEARVVQVAGRPVEPRIVPLLFDQRFAGFSEPERSSS